MGSKRPMTGASGTRILPMMLLGPALAALLSLPTAAQLPGVHLDRPARLTQPERCILHALANKFADDLGRHRGPEVEAALRSVASGRLPLIRYETGTPLAEFQDAVETQEPGNRPAVFSNFYSVASDRIYLIDEAGYYRRLKRSIDDSLAHEYTHYIQVRFLGYTVEHLRNDDAEAMAVEYQTWYRDEYVKTGRAPACPD
jgi:hypothetical protein